MNPRMTATALVAVLFAIPALALGQGPRASSGHGFGDAQAPAAPPSVFITPPAAAPQAPQSGRATAPAARRGQLVNVKVEFTITDQIGTKAAVKKTMTMVVADGESSRIRSQVEYRVNTTMTTTKGEQPIKSYQTGVAPLSVDVNPTVEGNKIRLDFSVAYSVVDTADDGSLGTKTTVSERLAAVLDNGVPLVVAQSSDAVSDRKVTVEIKASILK